MLKVKKFLKAQIITIDDLQNYLEFIHILCSQQLTESTEKYDFCLYTSYLSHNFLTHQLLNHLSATEH